jgi:predicted nuclease of predicted toxin-antitoxin system
MLQRFPVKKYTTNHSPAMPEFLIDVNLPSKVQIWQSERFIHVSSINAYWSDTEIWEYAKANNLTIINKDKDFLIYQLANGTPPKIVHIKFGNLKLKDFILMIESSWKEVEILLKDHSLINIYIDKIEAIK